MADMVDSIVKILTAVTAFLVAWQQVNARKMERKLDHNTDVSEQAKNAANEAASAAIATQETVAKSSGQV